MIHDSAIIDPSAKLGNGVSIGPWSIIGPNVEVGDNVEIASNVIVKGPSRIGSGVRTVSYTHLTLPTKA